MSFIQTNWSLILVMLVSGALLAWPILQRRLSAVRELGTADATRLINRSDAVLLDIRDTKEIAAGRLPNALHIPMSELQARRTELAKLTTRPVIVYCSRGNRSAGATRVLSGLGFKEIYGLRGGFAAWRDAGLPVQK
jgi:rhodanese-related sulfurtransferase